MAVIHRPAVFLDKDGTLVRDVPYNVDPPLVELTAGAGAGLRLLADAGYALVVVTNQSGVARGLFPEAALEGVERRIGQLLSPFGVALDGFLHCPHLPSGTVPAYAVACECRKPAPGMLRNAAESLGLNLGRSWLIGDILNDVEAAHAAGARAVLLDVGSETEWVRGPLRTPDLVASDVLDAARAIVAADRRDAPGPEHADEHRGVTSPVSSDEWAVRA